MDNAAGTLARGWIEAWQRLDMEWLRKHLSPGFVHTSPFGRLEGREHYLATVEPLARKSVAALRVRRVIAEGSEATIWFENRTAAGPAETCDWLRVEGNRIVEIRSFYDSAPVRRTLSLEEQEQLDGG